MKKPICHPKKKHYSKGLCLSCYQRRYYENNPKFKEKQKERVRKAIKRLYKRRMKEDPLWNAKRQREYVRKYPERHYFQQARFYWKRLTPQQRKELIHGKA
jgi:catalase